MQFNPEHIQQQSSFKKEGKSITDFLNQDIRLSKHLSNKDLEYVYNQLQILIESGLDLHASIELIINTSAKRKYLVKILEQIKNSMLSGISFSESLEKTEAFLPFDYYAIKIGEESGKLVEVFTDLRAHYTKRIATKRLLVSSLTYPIIVITFTIAVVFFLMTFLVPMFKDMFQKVGGELPAITQYVINTSSFVENNIGTLAISLLVCIVLFSYLKKQPVVRRQFDYFILKIPFLKVFVQKANLLRYLQLMLLLNRSYVPLMDSLSLIQKSTTFYPLNDVIDDLKADLLKGRLISESMQKHSIFEPKLVALVRVGEEGNQLPMIYERLIDQYQEDITHLNKVLTTFIEPIIVLFLGIIVAIVLISMYMPLFDINSGANF